VLPAVFKIDLSAVRIDEGRAFGKRPMQLPVLVSILNKPHFSTSPALQYTRGHPEIP
jgi:hypothetical protein